MSIYENLKTFIQENIKPNGQGEITGQVLQDVLMSMADSLERNAIIVRGDVDSSGILEGEYKGYSNKAISRTSMAVGAATTAGLKGWYYSAIDFATKKITLSDRPTYILSDSMLNGGWSSGVPNIEVDDVISLVNNSKYDLCSKVTAVNGNVITVDSLPFTILIRDSGTAAAVLAGQFSDGYSVYIPERPDAGLIDFGGGAFSEGGQSKASNICAHAEGLQTHAYGQYSHTEGRETKAGYAAHAEGRSSIASGQSSHAEGNRNTASGNASHAEGNRNTASGNASHAEGGSTTASGKQSHAEGNTTVASGEASHAEGYQTEATDNQSHAEGGSTHATGKQSHAEGWSTTAQGVHSHAEGGYTTASGKQSHVGGNNSIASGARSFAHGNRVETSNADEVAFGKYNKSTNSSDASQATHFSIGIGTSNTKRKNAVEVKQNGDVYIIGVGGYDGTNSNSAQTLQEILANL